MWNFSEKPQNIFKPNGHAEDKERHPNLDTGAGARDRYTESLIGNGIPGGKIDKKWQNI